MNDRPPFTIPQIAGLVPGTWINHQEVTKPTHRRTVPNADSVRIRHSQLNFPISIWERIGKPSKMTCFFQGLDTILVGADDFRIKVGKTWAYVSFENKCEKFRPYLIPGIYRPDRYKVEVLGDIKYLRIIGSNFTTINRQWLRHWTQH